MAPGIDVTVTSRPDEVDAAERVVFPGQGAMPDCMRTLRESVMPYGAQDEHQFRRSLREVQRYVEQTPSAVVVPGHDLEAFRALERVYE